MRGIRLQVVWTVSVSALLAVGAAWAQPDVVFMASSPKDEYEAGVYRAIWDEYGEE